MSTPWTRHRPPSGCVDAARLPSIADAGSPARPVAFRYPPADPGLPLLDAGDILAANDDLIARLRLHAAVDPAQFDARFQQPLARLARTINVLPATSAGLFAGEMGLFRAALEGGFYCFQASDGRIFTGAEGVERRHALEGRWRYLCFLAGLLYPLGSPLERLHVASADGRTWKRHRQGLSAWAAAESIERVFVSWGNCDADEKVGPGAAALALLPQIAGADNLQHLEDGAIDLVDALQQLVLGHRGSSPIAHQVVTSCWERICRREARRRPQAYGRLVAGTHQAPYLLGAMRTLVETGRWVPNASCLRTDVTGTYLQWPQAATELIAWGRQQGMAGWPADPATLAALLVAAGIVHAHASDLGLLRIRDGAGAWCEALKFVDPLAVLEDDVPASYPPQGVTGPSSAEDPPAPAPASDLPQEGAPAGGGPVASAPAALPKPVGTLAPPASSPAGSPPPCVAVVAPVDGVPVGQAQPSAQDRFSCVPPDVQKEIGHPVHLELLATIVQTWRSRGAASHSMRRIEPGLAITLAFLAEHTRDVTRWVDAMAKAGLVHAPPQTPGLRVQHIPIPEGGRGVPTVVLSNLACRKLQL